MMRGVICDFTATIVIKLSLLPQGLPKAVRAVPVPPEPVHLLPVPLLQAQKGRRPQAKAAGKLHPAPLQAGLLHPEKHLPVHPPKLPAGLLQAAAKRAVKRQALQREAVPLLLRQGPAPVSGEQGRQLFRIQTSEIPYMGRILRGALLMVLKRETEGLPAGPIPGLLIISGSV